MAACFARVYIVFPQPLAVKITLLLPQLKNVSVEPGKTLYGFFDTPFQRYPNRSAPFKKEIFSGIP